MFRYGDCSSCTAKACFSVPSKTASPVVLTKSASRTLSFSVSLEDWRERQYRMPPINRTSTITAGTRSFHNSLGAEIALTVAADTAEADAAGDDACAAGAVCTEAERGVRACAAADGPESAAAGTEPELVAAARPLSVSRFRRCRSARMSAALW